MSTCNRLDLQTLGYQRVMPKNLPDQYGGVLIQVTPSFGCHLFFWSLSRQQVKATVVPSSRIGEVNLVSFIIIHMFLAPDWQYSRFSSSVGK